MVPPDRFPDVAKGLSEAPSRVAWLARRLTKLRRPAISKEEYYPNTTLERSANPATTYVLCTVNSRLLQVRLPF